MFRLIDYAISHSRLTIALLLFLLGAGFVSYVTIPKEAEPDVKIPIIYVQLTQRGISPEDSERLLLKVVETQLKQVSNVKEMRSTAFEGGGYVLLEFEAGFNSNVALADVRAKVDQAKRDLPKDADEPSVQEVNLSLYPVLVVALAGDVPERTLLQDRAAGEKRHRAGAGRAFRGTARRARRGGRDHLRADADEELRHLARSDDRRLQCLQHADRGRLARRPDRPLRREGAEPDRAAAGRAQHADRGLRRRGGDAGRRRADQADLQGRHVGDAGQRADGDDRRSLQAHRRQPDRDRRRREADHRAR